MLEDVKAAPLTILIRTITKTKDEQHKPQRALPTMEKESRGKNQGTWTEVSQLAELQKGVGKTEVHRKCSKLSIHEALEAAKQKLTALVNKLKRCSTEEKQRPGE